jgi:putative transposase
VCSQPDTILSWHRRLIAQTFDGSKHHSYPGRPRVGREVADLIVRMARENSGWGYDRIVGALGILGRIVSDQTVVNFAVTAIAPAPRRSQSTSWSSFIAAHMAILVGIDFSTVEVLTWRGLATYYVLFFLHDETRRMSLGGITRHPTETWMEQIARMRSTRPPGIWVTFAMFCSIEIPKFCASFRAALTTGGVECIALQPRSPNLNAFAERWIRSVKQECLSKLILFGERAL